MRPGKPGGSRQLERMSHSSAGAQVRGAFPLSGPCSWLEGTKMPPRRVGGQGAKGRFRASGVAPAFRSCYLLVLRGSQCRSHAVSFSQCGEHDHEWFQAVSQQLSRCTGRDSADPHRTLGNEKNQQC